MAKKNNYKSRKHYEKAHEIFMNNLKDGWVSRHSLAIRCDVTVPTIMNWIKALGNDTDKFVLEENAFGEFRYVKVKPNYTVEIFDSYAAHQYFKYVILPEMVKMMEDTLKDFDPMDMVEKENFMLKGIVMCRELRSRVAEEQSTTIVDDLADYERIFKCITNGTPPTAHRRLMMLFRQAKACMRPYL